LATVAFDRKYDITEVNNGKKKSKDGKKKIDTAVMLKPGEGSSSRGVSRRLVQSLWMIRIFLEHREC